MTRAATVAVLGAACSLLLLPRRRCFAQQARAARRPSARHRRRSDRRRASRRDRRHHRAGGRHQGGRARAGRDLRSGRRGDRAACPAATRAPAEFPGFATDLARDVRVRRRRQQADDRARDREVCSDAMTVGRDKQEAAADRARHVRHGAHPRAGRRALGRSGRDAQQLQDMAGRCRCIRVDSFEGGDLPPKSHDQVDPRHARHLRRGKPQRRRIFIDIITQPGIGPLRGGGRFSLRDGVDRAAAVPFTPVKGPERMQHFGTNFAGTMIAGSGLVLPFAQRLDLVRHAEPVRRAARRARAPRR